MTESQRRRVRRLSIPMRGAAYALAAAGVLAAPALAAAQQPAARAIPDPDTLRLAEVYRLAGNANPMLLAARARAEAAAARAPSASLPPDPELQLGAMNLALPGLDADMPGSMAPSVQLMQMVPLPGKLALSGKIARQGTAIAGAEAEAARWEARALAAMAYYEIYSLDRRTAVMRETLGLLQDFQQIARAMYATGQGRQSDVLRAGVEVARMQSEIARMQAMRAGAAARLNAVLARPAETPVPAVALPALPLALPAADTLRAWAEAGRPLLERGRLGVEQARTQRALAKRELWPDVAVGFQYGQRPSAMGTERMGSVMLGFTLPVFAGRRQLAMRTEAAAMQRMAEAELTDARARTHARLGELLAELEQARTLIALYRSEVLPQARAAVTSSLSSYRVGSVDFMTLLDAQMTQNQYQQELYALLADYGRALAELEMATGRELPETSAALTEEAR